MQTIKEMVEYLSGLFEANQVSAFTEDTKELVNVSVIFDPYVDPYEMLANDLTLDQVKRMASVRLMNHYMCIRERDDEECANNSTFYANNLYAGDKYFPYFDMAMRGLDLTSDRRNDTRQMVVTFPPEHCFETLHFMVRDTVLIFICNMRSCNFKKNYVDDIFMMCLLMNEVRKVLESQMQIVIPRIIPCFNFGSLHVFTGDEKKSNVVSMLDMKAKKAKKEVR